MIRLHRQELPRLAPYWEKDIKETPFVERAFVQPTGLFEGAIRIIMQTSMRSVDPRTRTPHGGDLNAGPERPIPTALYKSER